MAKEYVLRERDDDEISRLAFQHEVWKETSDFAIEKVNVRPGDQIIDLGSGPGYLSYEIEKLLGEKGRIFCVDNSEKFVQFIQKSGHKQVEALHLDIREDLSGKFKDQQIDKVFCRWVLMFNDRVDQIIQQVFNTLASGGKFISIEYFNFQQIDIFPRSHAFNDLYQKVETLLKNNGGNPNIGRLMHAKMAECGFRNIEVFPIYRTGKVDSPLWKWLERTNENHINLVKAELMTQAELDQYMQDWEDRSKDLIAFITAPPLMITIGEK